MNFAVWLGNHSPEGQRSLEDVCGIWGHCARALGHEAVWDPSNNASPRFLKSHAGLNVIVEGFTPSVIALIAEHHAQGARFICLATEEPTETGGFNHSKPGTEMWLRQQIFPEAMKYFDGILHLVPGQHVTDWYSQWAPSAYTELGYAPSLIRKHDHGQPEYEFGFFGSLSKRRLKILRRLNHSFGIGFERRKTIRIEATFPDQTKRDTIMREAKVILQIRKFDEMGLVSSSRCNTALCIGRPVIAEPHLLSHPWDEVVRFTPKYDSEDKTFQAFFDQALMMRSAWKGVHAAQMERFKAKMSPEICVGRALREIGLDLNERKSA